LIGVVAVVVVVFAIVGGSLGAAAAATVNRDRLPQNLATFTSVDCPFDGINAKP